MSRPLFVTESAYLKRLGIEPSVKIGARFLCRVCGQEHEEAEFTYHQLGLCGHCAEAVANLFNHAHSGDYITWTKDLSR